MTCMHKIAVIGGSQTVMGFKALGLETYPADSADAALKAFKALTGEDSDYAIIYIEEGLAQDLHNEIDRFKDKPAPAVIVIPGRDGSIGLGLAALNSSVERAVGTNILN